MIRLRITPFVRRYVVVRLFVHDLRLSLKRDHRFLQYTSEEVWYQPVIHPTTFSLSRFTPGLLTTETFCCTCSETTRFCFH